MLNVCFCKQTFRLYLLGSSWTAAYGRGIYLDPHGPVGPWGVPSMRSAAKLVGGGGRRPMIGWLSAPVRIVRP